MKKIILFIVFLFGYLFIYCQHFMHGAGLTQFLSSSSLAKAPFPFGLTYSARFNILETGKISVSIGVPIAIGIAADDKFLSKTASNGVAVNAPFLTNLNIGRGSTKKNKDRVGYFFGAGFGFNYTGINKRTYNTNLTDYTSKFESINKYGPAANAGMRFGVGRKHKNIEARFFYMRIINKNQFNLFGYGGVFNF